MYHDRKEGAITGSLSPLPHTVILLLPDTGQYRYILMHFCHISLWFYCEGKLFMSSHSRGLALGMSLSATGWIAIIFCYHLTFLLLQPIGQCFHLFREVSAHLLDELAQTFAQTFMVPRGWASLAPT